jgi:MFS transporter, PAT family, beta-lactamase induction signal transducer AmpG
MPGRYSPDAPDLATGSGARRTPWVGWRRDWPPPWIFLLMPLPFGIFSGYVQTALPWLLRRMGYSVNSIGAVVALILSPMAFAFLWGPLADFGFRRRTWMLLMSALSGVLLGAAILLLGANALLATWLLFAGYAVSLFTTACGGGLLAATQAEGVKSRAAAWMQGGMLTSSALGGALLLYCSKQLTLSALAVGAALLVTAPAFVALTIPEPAPLSDLKNFWKTCTTMGGEIRATLFSMRSLPGILLLFAPVGTGAAQSLFAAMAKDYHVGMQGVLLLNGLLGGSLNMIGAYVAVIVPSHWDRRIAYAAAGLACAGVGAYLTFAPLNPITYLTGVALYMLTTGACYGFFLGVVMVTMGDAGLSASGRYAILVSLGDLPIVYMTVVEGWSFKLFGVRGVPASDCLGNLLVAICTAGWLVLGLNSANAPARIREQTVEESSTASVAVSIAIEPVSLE